MAPGFSVFAIFTSVVILIGFLFCLLEQLLSCDGEYIFNVGASFRAGLKDFVYIVLFGELDCTVELHFPLVLEVALVAYQVNLHILGCVLLDFFEPVN